MRLCQRRQPPKAVAAGQRLQSHIPAATIDRGAGGAALFKATLLDRAVPVQDATCCVWYPRFARATAWRRASQPRPSRAPVPGQQQAQRITERVDQRMDLGAQTAAAVAKGLVLSFF
jgi:hypothetical protein